MRKAAIIAAGFLLLSLFAIQVSAQFPNGNPFGSNTDVGNLGIFEPIKSIVQPIINLFVQAGKVQGDNLEGLTRFIIWIILFAVFYGGMKAVNLSWLTNNVRLVLALALAALSSIFMPTWAVAQIGSSYGQIAFFILLLPIFGTIVYLAAWHFRNEPRLSAPLWFITLVLISYFNQIFSIARPADNRIPLAGSLTATGILQPIFQVAGAIAAIAFIVQSIRALGQLSGLFGGGQNQNQGEGLNLGRLFGGGGNRDEHQNNNQGGQQGQGGQHGQGGEIPGNAHPLRIHIRGPANGHQVRVNTPVRFIIEVEGGRPDITIAARATFNGQQQGIMQRIIRNDGQRAFEFTHTFNQAGDYHIEFVAHDSENRDNANSIVLRVGQHQDMALHIIHPSRRTLPENRPVRFEAIATAGNLPITWTVTVVDRNTNAIVYQHQLNTANHGPMVHEHQIPAGQYRVGFLAQEHGPRGANAGVDFDVTTPGGGGGARGARFEVVVAGQAHAGGVVDSTDLTNHPQSTFIVRNSGAGGILGWVASASPGLAISHNRGDLAAGGHQVVNVARTQQQFPPGAIPHVTIIGRKGRVPQNIRQHVAGAVGKVIIRYRV